MAIAPKILLIVAALGLAACNNPNRFGQGGPDGAGGGFGAGGIDQSALGGAGDPNSPAYFQQTLGDRVFFAVDQSTLSGEAQATLAAQAQWLNNQGARYAIIIEGHADEQGTREYNIALGDRRANSVRNYLVSQGVSAGRLRTVSYGKERPVEVCSTEACYSRNRRAVTVLSAGAGV
ncbi:MAG: peptidoglycan-associated lipoprotein Pal [Gemmobacter sp.]